MEEADWELRRDEMMMHDWDGTRNDGMRFNDVGHGGLSDMAEAHDDWGLIVDSLVWI